MTEEMMISPGGRRRSGSRARLAAVALICGAAFIAGCSSTTTASSSPKATSTHAAQSPTPSGSATSLAAACVHINSLRMSLESLTTLKVNPTSAGQLTHDLTNIGTQLTALRGMNLGAFSASASQLTAEIDKITKDAAELATNPTKAISSLTTDLTTLKSKAGPLIAEMKSVCHV